MPDQFETLEELIKWLLYIREVEARSKQEICVGVIGDSDISAYLSPNLRRELIRILEGNDEN